MILYHFINNKWINGTLFYCFEYFVFLNQYQDTEFWLFDITDKKLQYIKEIFKNKYDFDTELLSKIKRVNLKDFKKTHEKAIILDNRTYHNLRLFLSDTEVLWQKTDNPSFNFSIDKTSEKDTLFGSYHFHKYEIEQHLQFHFDIYKPLRKTKNQIYISSLSIDKDKVVKILQTRGIFLDNKIFFKDTTNHKENLFEEFNTFLYLKNDSLDTNNRLIVESYYYNKNIILVDDKQDDSSFQRLQELNEYGIEYFRLSLKNKLIQKYLGLAGKEAEVDNK
jgi:hypothetical protein